MEERESVKLSRNGGEDIEEKNEEEERVENVSEFRTLLPQFIAATSINLILLELGMILGLPTIVIPELVKSTDNLSFTENQASWFGSIALIFQPFGSTLSGLFEPLGRKRTMMYVNVPLIGGWLLTYFASEVYQLYIAEIIMGLSIGFMDAPHITYLGEIAQPKWRGILTSYAEICVAFGYCVVYFSGTIVDWRTTCAICSAVPFLTFVLISRIPESPVWLLSKKRNEEAKRSLSWLRGWVKPHTIHEEFTGMIRHNEAHLIRRNSSAVKGLGGLNKSKKTTFLMKIKRDVLRRPILRPFFLLAAYFGFSHMAGVTNTRPFMVEILEEFGTPHNPFWVTAISSVVGVVGFITGMVLIPKIGKRKLSIVSMMGCAAADIMISIYGFFLTNLNLPWIPVSFYVILNYIHSLGAAQVPWMLVSEVFPLRGRAIASGLVAALAYVQAFIFIKTFFTLHNLLTLPGIFALYGLFSVVGTLLLYIYLPETEGKTLEEIESVVENHFNNVSRRLRVSENEDRKTTV